MCGRYYLDYENDPALRALCAQASERLPDNASVAAGEVCPGRVVAALARQNDGRIAAVPMRWGFSKPDSKGLIINARSETAAQKPMFSESLLQRRCLIPASWYFEWETRDAQTSLFDLSSEKPRSPVRIKYAIRPPQEAVVWLAGVYRYEPDQPLPAFVILTRAADASVAFIHDRMPVIFSRNEAAAWLKTDADPQKMIPLALENMQFFQEQPS